MFRTFWRMYQIYSQGTQWFANPGKHEWALCGVHWACGRKVGKGCGSCCTSGEAGPRSFLQTAVLRVPCIWHSKPDPACYMLRLIQNHDTIGPLRLCIVTFLFERQTLEFGSGSTCMACLLFHVTIDSWLVSFCWLNPYTLWVAVDMLCYSANLGCIREY